MINEHTLPKSMCRRGQPLRVLVVGAGGNGSAMLLGLPYLHQAMKVWGHAGGLHVMLADGDQVTETNCVRQPFATADVGLNKATVLINPRIQHAVRQKFKDAAVSQEELQKLIMELSGVSELFKSIRDNGGLLEPIYVRPDGRVIEGNCRAACYLKLRASIKGKDNRWETIPAVLVPNISDRQVAILQGHYHVAGKNKWQAYEKAGHLHTMRTILKMDDKAIAQALGMRERDVTRDLKAYETMTHKLLPQIKTGNGLDKWSFVQELFKRKDLEEYRNNPGNVDEFVSLVVSNKIKYGADVRKLSKILKHPTATKVLAKQGVESAMSVVGKADPAADSGTFRKLKEATRLLQQLPSKELQRLRENENSRSILQDLFSALKNAAKAAGVKLSQ